MKSVLVYDVDLSRDSNLGLLLRLGRYHYHVVGSLEEACNHVATLGGASERYHCLLVNNIDTPASSEAVVTRLARHRFPLTILLVERFRRCDQREVFGSEGSMRVLRCRPESINEALSFIAVLPSVSALAFVS